jgi:hypothetical protein
MTQRMLRSRRPWHRGRGAAGNRDPGDTFTAATVEFKMIGTAVPAKLPAAARPFTTELSGPDFATLLVVGWMPAGIALGISAAGLHDNLATTSSGPWGPGNAEGRYPPVPI